MIWRIAHQEWRAAWRARTLPAFGLVLWLLLVAAAIVGHDRAATHAVQRAAAQSLVDTQFREQPERHPHRVAHYGFLVFRPEAPLAVFDRGLDAFAGSTIFLEAHRQNLPTFADAAHASGIRRFGELTMALILQLFVPLLVLCAAALAISQNRDDGTLPLTLCQGAAPSTIVVGKWLALTASTIAVVTPGVLVAWIASGGLPGAWTADALQRGALLAVTHTGFVGCVVAVGLAISAWARTSQAALALAISVWLISWIIVPRLMPIVADAAAPAPSRAAFEADVEREVRRVGDSHNPNDPNFAALRARTLAEYGVSRVDDLPVNYNGIVMREGERLTSETYQRTLDTLHDTWGAQARWLLGSGIVSPYVAIRSLSMTLSGTDAARARAFDAQAEAYRYRLIQALNDLHIDEVAYSRDRYQGESRENIPSRMRIARTHWEDLPTFTFEPPTLMASIKAAPGALLMSGWWLVAGMAALVAAAAGIRRAPR